MKYLSLAASLLGAASLLAQIPPATFTGPILTLPQMSYALNGFLYQTNASTGQNFSGTVDVTNATYPTLTGQLEVFIAPGGYEVLPIAGATGFVTAGYVTLLNTPDPNASPLYFCTFTQQSNTTGPAAWSSCSTPVQLVIPPVNGFVYSTPGIVGRYVRIAGPQYLALAEVQVYAPNQATDIALHQPTTQSSVYPTTNGVTPTSDLAVDGNTDGVFADGSVTHTAGTEPGWWQVDLGSNQPVGKIVVWNRTDCCGDRLTNFTISISINADGSAPIWSYLVTTPPTVSASFILTTFGTPASTLN